MSKDKYLRDKSQIAKIYEIHNTAAIYVDILSFLKRKNAYFLHMVLPKGHSHVKR